MGTISYTTLPAFECYFRPKTIGDAVLLLSKYGVEGKILAGGTDLLLLMRDRVVSPKHIIDITKIQGLDRIELGEDALTIGALVTLRAVELSLEVKEHFPLLYEAVREMGSVQVRNMGTLVGNICRASPAADTAPPLLALESQIEMVSPTKTRILPLHKFFTGPGQTILEHDEMLTKVRVPRLPFRSGTAFFRATRVAVDLAKVNVACILIVTNGICEDIRIALGGVAPIPMRARKVEAVLKGNRLRREVIDEAASVSAEEIKPISDLRSTEDYRKELCRILVRRAIYLSLERIKT